MKLLGLPGLKISGPNDSGPGCRAFHLWVLEMCMIKAERAVLSSRATKVSGFGVSGF